MDSTAAESDILVSVQDVSFSYSSFPVLADIHLDILRGHFLAVLGPNGSGKTTLIKIILGLLKPDSGRILVMGRPIESLKDRGRIGYVPQKATHIDTYFPASAAEVVDMALKSTAGTGSRMAGGRSGAVREALDRVGMADFSGRRIGDMSGGQQQRVFIARALVTRPEILFLDEPTGGVDSGTQTHFYEMLGDLNKSENLTIVIVTHDIGIVNKHVNTVACLNRTLVYHGTHEEYCRSESLGLFLKGGHHLVAHHH